MSEPRAIADGVQELIPGLFHYRVHDERIDFPSEAFVVGTASGVVLVDPLPLDDATVTRLGAVEAIVLSVASHQRSAWRFRRLTGAPVHAPAGAVGPTCRTSTATACPAACGRFTHPGRPRRTMRSTSTKDLVSCCSGT